jgi:signal transduction histidine kinase
MRLVPRSLTGQLALVLTAALLLASAVNFGVLLTERRRSAIYELTGPAVTRFADFAAQLAAGDTDQRPARWQNRRGPGVGRLFVADRSLTAARALPRSDRLEARLRRALEEAGVDVQTVQASARTLRDPEEIWRAIVQERQRMDRRPARGEPPFVLYGPPPMRRVDMGAARQIVLSAQLSDGRWINLETIAPAPRNDDVVQLAITTLVLFAAVLGAALFVSSRLSRPLRDLAGAARQIGSSAEPQQVVLRGPDDVRQTIEAFNAMSQRVSQLLTEKDVMLGAIGHDLRTPLTSLRIRLESMEPEAEREKAIAAVEETAALLDAILELARQGRTGEPLQLVDLADLATNLAREYAETGKAVSLGALASISLTVRPLLLRRLLRNLIDNALAYAGSARVSVASEPGAAVVVVEDEGPGIPTGDLAQARRPFIRGEAWGLRWRKRSPRPTAASL